VAHAYNPSFSGGRDQEDLGSKPAWANSSGDPTSKNASQKWVGGVALGVGPEFEPQVLQKTNKQKNQTHHFSNIPENNFEMVVFWIHWFK
jgi:hypothetical protein